MVNIDDCWIFAGFKTKKGYGEIQIRIAPRKYKKLRAHRVMYEALVGMIPDGLVIDHLCEIKACVNPDHMEPVTSGENTKRGIDSLILRRRKECIDLGHEFFTNKKRRMWCRDCFKASCKKRYKEVTKPKANNH